MLEHYFVKPATVDRMRANVAGAYSSARSSQVEQKVIPSKPLPPRLRPTASL